MKKLCFTPFFVHRCLMGNGYIFNELRDYMIKDRIIRRNAKCQPTTNILEVTIYNKMTV